VAITSPAIQPSRPAPAHTSAGRRVSSAMISAAPATISGTLMARPRTSKGMLPLAAAATAMTLSRLMTMSAIATICTAAKHHAPEPLPRRQAAARHSDDERVVTRQQDVDPHDLAERNPEGRLLHLGLELGEERRDRRGIQDLPQPVHKCFSPRPFSRCARLLPAAFPIDQPTISLPEKNCAISIAAVSVASEPCTEFSPIDFAWTLRIVPSAALDGSVAPITSRYFNTAP